MTDMQLSELKMALLRAVDGAGGRECTETLYDMVEEARPTMDEDGEEFEGMDPYETSREEIGDLESWGFLAHDEDGMAGFGYSSLTDKGRLALECAGCRHTGMNPSHRGSKRCQSGSVASGGTRTHCSCDTCF
jgi:hypothetical protein